MFLIANSLCFLTITQNYAYTKYFDDSRTTIVLFTPRDIAGALDVSAGIAAMPSSPHERLHGCAVVQGDR